MRIFNTLGWVKVMLTVAPLYGSALEVYATHLRAGEITVERLSCAGRTFRITVTVYTDTESGILFGGTQDILNFGDGTSLLIPETPHTPLPGGGNLGYAQRSFIHTFPGPGKYTIRYTEPNRNAGVLNISNSVNTTFYIETEIDLAANGCGDSPKMLIPPIDRACTGVAFYHNPGAYDPDGDSLSYELVIPNQDYKKPVVGYRPLNDPKFYPDFDQGNENGDGPPTFTINPVDGTIIWDAPSLPSTLTSGEFNIAFIVKEWRKTNGVWVNIGFVRRDMQIIVEKCTNERPKLIVPDDVCVVAGTTVDATILGIDPENHNVKIEAFSEIFAPTFESPASVSPFPAVFQPSNPPAELQFTWNTECVHVKDQPYQVVFKITDNPPLGPKLVTFETWQIRVVAPPPVWEPPVVNAAKRHVKLEWEAYECFEEASVMQIWRKVDSSSFTPIECQTGLPESLGYSLIAQRPIKNAQGVPDTTFTDTNNGKGLDVGAQYCYRLVALFAAPRGGESYASTEICIDPIGADAPVITNVTVDVTGQTDGEVTVRWTPPFDIDTGQFPGPYGYLVQRASGAGFLNVSGTPPTLVLDTVFVDQGLNTRDLTFTYRVILYEQSDPMQPIDTSALASSPAVELATQKDTITVTWNAIVPWSNQLQDYPLHDIYRGPEGSDEGDLQLIATVDVTQDGFKYIDYGQHDGVKLDGNTEYCYRVMLRGGYGNDQIEEPLLNYSQINCGRPVDVVPPCTPIVEAFESVCDDNFVANYGCNPTNFTNTLRWMAPCPEDVRSYNIYVAGSTQGTYVLLANVRDTFYLDAGLASLARCYRISSLDRSGNESELSEPVCNDNCPYYELPNVFTPGDNNDCNDLFSAFGVSLTTGESPRCQKPVDEDPRCARFVQRVHFTVFNRWGREVYDYTGQLGDENTIYINWDGRDDQGRELANGVYFYSAEVTYDVVDPSERVKVLKGWIHLIRYAD